MSVRFDANGECMAKTGGAQAFGDRTWMAWIYRVGTNSNSQILNYMATSNGYANYLGLGVYISPFQLYVEASIPGNTVYGTALATATWYHVAYVFNDAGNTLTSYLNGVQDQQMTGVTGTFTPGFEATGNFDTAGAYPNYFNGRIAAIKCYAGTGAALTAAEIANEMLCFMPVRVANLRQWFPCVEPVAANNVTDYSGNGNSYVAGGTLTVEDNPPIPWALQQPTRRRKAGVVIPPTGTILPHMMQHMGA